jgi:uncharacterized membrane protein required for colicin V production
MKPAQKALASGKDYAKLSFMMQMAALPSLLSTAKFNYFDCLAIVWLIIGLFRGRKQGMSQEVLPLLQWIGIVAAGGLLYWPFSSLIHQYTMFGTLWSCITAYLLIAGGVHLIYLWFKQMLAEKLVESDPFGRAEFYLGMASGVVRFACILLAVMALMNSHVTTAAELAKTEHFQADNFSGIRFPTYGQVQQDVLFKSFTGSFVESKMKSVLIASINLGTPPKKQTLAQMRSQTLDDIVIQPGKK